jgi:cell wall-associated NlpC family hydrolase
MVSPMRHPMNVDCRSWLLVLSILLILAACSRQITPSIAPKTTEPDVSQGLSSNLYAIQAGAFSSDQAAVRYTDRLRQANLNAYYFLDDDQLYKVRLGPYESQPLAHRSAIYLQEKKIINTFLVVRSLPASHSLPSSTGESVVQTARSFLGTPYRWGGDSRENGVDCSGLTKKVYHLNGLQLPRTANSQFQKGKPVSRHLLKKGDLVFFATRRSSQVSHVGIYSGDNHFIHAPGRGKKVRKTSLSNTYFEPRYQGARRYF